MSAQLPQLGWSDELQTIWENMETDGSLPGRIVADYGASYKVAIPHEITAEISGRLEYTSEPHEKPKVGDWVAIQLIDDGHGIIHTVLPRKSEISRKQPGKKFEKQVLAANIDVAFLVQSLDNDFSPDRLRRYVFQLQKESVKPIVVLNKSDKVEELVTYLKELESFDIKVLVTSALENKGIEEIANHIPSQATAVFLGSSGVGKSTITNRLLGENKQDTGAIREEDSKGRHTTTHRELFLLPNGGMIIDTPGLRELQLWGAEEDLNTAFRDIEQLSQQCQFANCKHTTEPNCAVQAAIRSGTLDAQRLEAYRKLLSELQYLRTKVDTTSARERKIDHKKAQKRFNQILRSKDEWED